MACLAGLVPAATAGPAAADSLTAGATTLVPASMNPGVKDAFGEPYVVQTRVTGVRFHNGSLPSTAPGGLVPTPHPLLKTLPARGNQPEFHYYQVTGELSGVGHSPIGFEYVYGPLDANGVDQSANPASPRFGLRGLTFRLVYPANWNGHLIVYRNGGDGGRGSGHYLYQSITDELTLVRRGYAYFVTLGGTTTPRDSNPTSPSSLFWKLAPPFWPSSTPPHPDYLRAARISPDWSEHIIPDSNPGVAWFVGDPAPVSTPIGSRSFPSDIFMTMNDDTPTARDNVDFAKNLLKLLAGSRPIETGLVTWSRSGALAAGMDFGRTFQASPSVIAPVAFNPVTHQALSPRTGGDYNTPYVPSSGRVVDWFVVRSGLEGTTVPLPPDGAPDFADMRPDPQYPISAPFTYISAEADLRYVELNGYYFETFLADVLPGSALPNKDINNWLRLYTLRGMTHYPYEAWFAGPDDGGGHMWFEFGGAGLNTQHRGLELPAWMDVLLANNPALGDDLQVDFAGLLREEGFSLQAIINADRWAQTGQTPPESAIDGNLVIHPTGATRTPRYPVAEACTPQALFGERDFRCLETLREDSIWNDPGGDFGPLDEGFEVPLLKQFAAGPLRFTTRPIDLPDKAAPLGFRLLTTGAAYLHPFTRSQLVSRYGTHTGYVQAVTRAVAELVTRGLYDPSVGAMDIARAQASSVLR